MASELSVADAMALTRSDTSADGFGGTWTWVFFLFFLLAWGGGGMFGGNSASTEGSLTRSALYESNNIQDIFRNMGEISQQINAFQTESTNTWGNIRYDNLKNTNELSAQIAQNRYAADAANCATNRNIDALKYELSKENCEGIQKIADMLTADKIDSLRSELEAAKGQISNLMQSSNIINQIRPFPTPSYIVSSPYGTANGCSGYTTLSYGY